MNYMTVHEGFTGVLGGTLYETDYKAADEGKGQNFEKMAAGVPSTGGWLGITDTYWLTTLAVVDPAIRYRGAYRFVPENGQPRFQADLTPVAATTIAPANPTWCVPRQDRSCGLTCKQFCRWVMMSVSMASARRRAIGCWRGKRCACRRLMRRHPPARVRCASAAI
jgi:hypothetical protein